MGQIRYQTELVDTSYVLKTNRVIIPRFTEVGLNLAELKTNSINENFGILTDENERNKSLILDIQKNLSERRHILLLTHRLDHIEKLEEMLKDTINCPIFKLCGAQGAQKNKVSIEKIGELNKPFIILQQQNMLVREWISELLIR